jgi:hypothetical protein
MLKSKDIGSNIDHWAYFKRHLYIWLEKRCDILIEQIKLVFNNKYKIG